MHDVHEARWELVAVSVYSTILPSIVEPMPDSRVAFSSSASCVTGTATRGCASSPPVGAQTHRDRRARAGSAVEWALEGNVRATRRTRAPGHACATYNERANLELIARRLGDVLAERGRGACAAVIDDVSRRHRRARRRTERRARLPVRPPSHSEGRARPGVHRRLPAGARPRRRPNRGAVSRATESAEPRSAPLRRRRRHRELGARGRQAIHRVNDPRASLSATSPAGSSAGAARRSPFRSHPASERRATHSRSSPAP